MADRMLSAEKLSTLLRHLVSLGYYDSATIDRIEQDMCFGWLDADRPECPKCGGTGMVKFDYGYQGFEMACDCKLDLRNCGAKPEGK